MWNLFKNVFRSLKHNKISIIGLTFLTFISVGIFTVLNSTATNISKEYKRISKEGNLHDFTISENYDIGNFQYVSNTDDLDSNGVPIYAGIVDDNPTLSIPWPTQTGDTTTGFTRTYGWQLDIKGQENTLLGQFYTRFSKDPEYVNRLKPTTTVMSPNELTYLTDATTDTINHIVDHSKFSYDDVQDQIKDDMTSIVAQEGLNSSYLLNLITTTNTPMQKYLDDNMSNKVSYRNFKSIDINNSPDNIFYKMVQSNSNSILDPSDVGDTIDKEVLFNNGKDGWGSGQKNFSTSDFDPLLNEVDHGIDYDKVFHEEPFNGNIARLLDYKMPAPGPSSDPNPLTPEEEKQIIAWFKVVNCGDTSQISSTDPLIGYINDLVDTSPDTDDDPTAFDIGSYRDYYNNYYVAQVTTNKGYQYVLNWNTSIPQSWTMDDWSAKFAVAAPEFLSAKHLIPINDDWFIKDPSYLDWINKYTNITNERNRFIGWMNSLKEIERDEKLKKAEDNHSSSVVNLGTGLPFLILGSGITSDFIYPIVNVQHSTPNPNKECIVFGNTNAYNRVRDSYPGNPTENYLVGKFNKGINQKQILGQINQTAATLMNWPQNMRAAYMANDTTDYLNASAFRIAYIPSLLNKIKLIDYVLTILVLLLSLFICVVVIKRYINNSRVQIGIMQANGVPKHKIAFALLPFAVLPAVVGGIIGYLAGFFLQAPAIGLFSNYWMLPTTLAAFNWITLLVGILIPFGVFMLVSIISAFIVLRNKTVSLMKSGSEYKGNFITRYIKTPFAKFGIMVRFRVSFAFNSIWRLIILSIMAACLVTSLVFSITIIGKFDSAKNDTYASRNYTYAVDLYSPTTQGGQYIPVDANTLGESGFIQTQPQFEGDSGKNWMPNVYYDYSDGTDGNDWAFNNKLNDETYPEMFGSTTDTTFAGIPRQYYNSFMWNGSQTKGIEQGMATYIYNDDGTIKNTDKVCATTFLPTAADSFGQNNDLQFLKNRSMVKSVLDFNVGFMGAVSNPWSLAISLMPENYRNLCNGRTKDLIQQIGEWSCWRTNENGSDDATDNPYWNDVYGPQYWETHLTPGFDPSINPIPPHPYPPRDVKTFFKGTDEPISQIDLRNDPICPYNYSLDSDGCLGALGAYLAPDMMWFLNIAYNSNELHLLNDKIPVDDTPLNNDYQISYDKVPLKDTDETYTYLSVTPTKKGKPDSSSASSTSDIKILGIQDHSTHVKLKNASGQDLAPLIATSTNTLIDKPIIVNAYAAYKYNLKVGSKISFQINNAADRFQNEIDGISTKPSETFNVVGITTTYQGQEYFTNQQLANSLLGLKSGLDPRSDLHLHTWYNNTKYDVSDSSIEPYTTQVEGWNSSDPNSCIPNYLNDLDKMTPLRANPFDVNVTPYGFNGVFTTSTNGSSVLDGGMYLYSHNGIYPGNIALASDTVLNVLQSRLNLQEASIICGFYKPDKPEASSQLGKDINEAFILWQNSADNSTRQTNYLAYTSLAQKFVSELRKIYGDTAIVTLVTGAMDRDSTQMIFSNLSSTVTQVEQAVLAIIVLMVLIIVMLISVMLIGDAKRLVSMLKTLGYSDKQNAISFLSIYIPVILFGLLIAIPLSLALVAAFQAGIFAGVGILLTTNVPWWSYLTGMGAVVAVLIVTGFSGYYSLRKDRLANAIKEQ